MGYQNIYFFNKNGHQKNLYWNGNFWEGRILMSPVSANLFEMEHIFCVEKLLNSSGSTEYGFPHIDYPANYGNPMGITASFTEGSNVIILSGNLDNGFVGFPIYSPAYNGKILSISNTQLVMDGTSNYTGVYPFSILAWQSRFESLYNVVDFDAAPSINASWKSGNNFLTFSDTSITFLPGYTITGDGIMEGTLIVSISGNKVYINKNFANTQTNITCYGYLVETSNDVSGMIYQYNLITNPDFDSPLISNATQIYYSPTYDPSEIIVDGIRETSMISSSSLAINIALNANQEANIGRVLLIEDISQPIPQTILRLELAGEVIGEDERLNSLLSNFGRSFYKEDAAILRESDSNEPFPDFQILNRKRKELLLQGSEIFPYMGSYKGLFNIIKFFGYQDLTIKEYWLNIQKSATQSNSALYQNTSFINNINSIPYGESVLINNLLDDENSNKYKQVVIYGPNGDGTYGIQTPQEKMFPSTSYKKLPLFGLFYDINTVIPDEFDQFGFPITQETSLFSPDDILIKLFALKEKLKQNYLPLNAKIIDITGEGFYFEINRARVWVDNLRIDEVRQGLNLEMKATPNVGYIEDLRAFQIRTNPSLPQLPFVTGFEGNSNLSNFGNISDVSPFNQSYTPAEASSLITAIENYYIAINTLDGEINLGDGDYKNGGYYKFSDGTKYYLPGGFPTVLEVTSFAITMDDIGTEWKNLDRNIATYTTTLACVADLTDYLGDPLITQSLEQEITIDQNFGTILTLDLPPGFGNFLNPSNGKVQLNLTANTTGYNPEFDLNSIIGEVESYNNTTGVTTIYVLYTIGTGTYTKYSVNLTNLFSQNVSMEYYNYTFGNNGFYSWDNIMFLGYYEIEWEISLSGVNPYYYHIRGKIADYYRIPHVLPYLGTYSVKCKVYDNFNNVSICYTDQMITVEPRNIELTSIARFRQAETYTWDQMVLSWDNYDSQWIFPIEQQQVQPQPSPPILNYASYGNKYTEGQECQVLSLIPEVNASIKFNAGVKKNLISSISSIYGSGIGPATVTTTSVHGFNPGDTIYIVDYSTTSITGEYEVISVTTNTFVIPLIISSDINTSNNYVTGPGNIEIIINGIQYANIAYDGNIGTLAGSLYSTVNSSVNGPKFLVSSYTETTINPSDLTILGYEIIMIPPINTGALYNGQIVNINSSGSILLNNATDYILSNSLAPAFQGGANQYNDYIAYSPGDPLPTPEMKDWGTKNITWDSLSDITWDQLYSQTLSMYDFHHDWLGGFDLYNIRYGDLIQVGKNNPGVLITEGSSPINSISLYDVADQLNSSQDPGISKYHYTVRGYSSFGKNYSVDGDTGFSSPSVPTDIGPMNTNTSEYSLGINGTSICKGLNGEIYIADGTNIHRFISPTNIEIIQVAYPGEFIQFDRKGRIWYYGDSAVPLQIIDPNNLDKPIAFISQIESPTDYYNNIVIPANYTNGAITSLAIDDRNNDFAIVLTYDSGPITITKLFYFDGDREEFEIYDNTNGLPSVNIRQMTFDYKDGKKTLWIATDNGISIFDRIKFTNYNTGNSGLFSDNVYSLCIDEIDHKWIGTDSGISYFDGQTWAVWNNSNSPILPPNVAYTNIITTGHGNIFFGIYSSGVTNLGYFNGDNFIIYPNDPGTNNVFSPNYTITTTSPGYPTSYDNYWILSMDIKNVDGNYSQYPGNIFYNAKDNLGKITLRQIDYNIPHIHASSKYPGYDGWNFVYYNSSRSLPSVNNSPIGYVDGIINYNFIVGPLNGNYILGDLFRPKFPFADEYSWKIPEWIGFDFSGILSNHPDLNRDHLFLDAPLRDILNGKALKEEYWINPPIERIDAKKKRELISNFEWLIRLGDSQFDRGIKTTVDKEGYIYVTGYFSGNVYFGSPNNVNTGYTTTLNSPDCQSIFIAKYNSVGIIQWVRMYGETIGSPALNDYDYTPSSIKVDNLGNCYVVGYKVKTRNNLTDVSPSNLLVRLDWNGNLISGTELFSSYTTTFSENFDIAVDEANNLYIAGEFKGTLTSNSFSITTASPSIPEIYVAKIGYDGYIAYLEKLNTGFGEYNPSLALGDYNDLYIGFSNIGTGINYIKLNSYNALSFSLNWSNNIVYATTLITPNKPKIDISKYGEIVLGTTFNGNLSIGTTSINSLGGLDYVVFKFLTTSNLVWAKDIGFGYGDCINDVKIDRKGRVYILGSYSGTFYQDSPTPLETSDGDLDVLLIKLENDGNLLDIVSSGGLAKDEGLGICIDRDENIYLTGYISGAATFENYVTSPTSGGSQDIFIGKIPYQKFIPGNNYGNVVSWMGSQSWGWSDKRIYETEFEIPVGTTVFLNPLDSDIPGKQGHHWILSDINGNIIVDLKNVFYFIWTFKTPGYYTIQLSLQDTNGNTYSLNKPSYIRVVDHTAQFAGESVPHIINSNDFERLAIYDY